MKTVGPTTKTKRASASGQHHVDVREPLDALGDAGDGREDEADGEHDDDGDEHGVADLADAGDDLRPEPICRAPRPSEVAEPKSVAKIAKMSMTRPAGPSARCSPSSGANAELMSSERPLRKTP